MSPPSKLEKSHVADISARNRAFTKFAEKLGSGEVASRLDITDAQFRLYMHGGTPVPDLIWLRFVDHVLG